MEYIDLRSDTVTKPTRAMWEAMAKAEVGDDVYGEDPTVNRLQEIAAERLGKEAGLFVPSGTMGNLIAVLAHCGRGDEVIMGNLGHTFLFEGGGISALGGVHPHTLPNNADGTLELQAIREAIREDNPHYPTSQLIVLENTHNRCGGVAISAEYTRQVGEIAQGAGLKLHLDGARIFNAAAVLKASAAELAAPADSITFCLSKGLCAPVGSVLCGSQVFIDRAVRIRKQLGGGMRQAGVLAAAGIVALEQMTERVTEDHARAARLSQGLADVPGIVVEQKEHGTNMVFVRLSDEISMDAAAVVSRLKALGVLVGAVGSRRFRLVTHYWVDDLAVERTVAAFSEVL